jgi:hypothetical protein
LKKEGMLQLESTKDMRCPHCTLKSRLNRDLGVYTSIGNRQTITDYEQSTTCPQSPIQFNMGLTVDTTCYEMSLANSKGLFILFPQRKEGKSHELL